MSQTLEILEAEVARLREELQREQRLTRFTQTQTRDELMNERAAHEATKAELSKARAYIEQLLRPVASYWNQTGCAGQPDPVYALHQLRQLWGQRPAAATPAATGAEPGPYAYCERCKSLAGAVCGICRQARQTPAEREQET